MKKTSIKKTNQVLSVLLSSCMLLSATTAASATLVTDTTQNEQIQTNLPPEHTPKTWTLTSDIGPSNKYIIMPGDSVIYEGKTSSGTGMTDTGPVEYTWKQIGFEITSYRTQYLKSALPQIEFTKAKYKTDDDTEISTNIGFTNNTG